MQIRRFAYLLYMCINVYGGQGTTWRASSLLPPCEFLYFKSSGLVASTFADWTILQVQNNLDLYFSLVTNLWVLGQAPKL